MYTYKENNLVYHNSMKVIINFSFFLIVMLNQVLPNIDKIIDRLRKQLEEGKKNAKNVKSRK